MKKILKTEVKKYAAGGSGARSLLYSLLDDTQGIYGVIALVDADYALKTRERVVVFARLWAGHIIIEVDNTDKPLVDALIQQGVPREQIVLAYAGETLPDKTPVSGD